MSLFVGLDIGGTKFLVAAANEKGEIVHKIRHPTPLDLEQGLTLLHDMIDEVRQKQTLAGIGAAIGGPLDWEKGIVSPLHQPQWRNIPLKQIMQDKWQCSFAVDVDTNVAALAEFHQLQNRVSRFLYMTISTGVGGGLLTEGHLYRGTRGAHPEIGHQSIPFQCSFPERIECECGADYCIEALISGNGIRRIYQKPAEELNDDEWHEVAYNLGQSLRNMAALYTPDLIVLGGSVAVGGGERLVPRATDLMRSNLKIVPIPRVRLSQFAEVASLYGALLLAQKGSSALE
jgi:predicted NBD/HSP70 family sugar kinase